MTKTVGIYQEALAQFVVYSAQEFDNWELNIPEGVSDDDVWDGITAKNVTEVDSYGDEVEVVGKFQVREAVDRIPASGGGRLEPPTNPPEVITKERDVYFLIRFTFEDLGYATGTVEVV